MLSGCYCLLGWLFADLSVGLRVFVADLNLLLVSIVWVLYCALGCIVIVLFAVVCFGASWLLFVTLIVASIWVVVGFA